ELEQIQNSRFVQRQASEGRNEVVVERQRRERDGDESRHASSVPGRDHDGGEEERGRKERIAQRGRYRQRRAGTQYGERISPERLRPLARPHELHHSGMPMSPGLRIARTM